MRRDLVTRDARRDAGQRAGGARVDGDDAGVGVRAPEERDVQHAGERQVRDVPPLPLEEARVFHPADGRADERHCTDLRWAGRLGGWPTVGTGEAVLQGHDPPGARRLRGWPAVGTGGAVRQAHDPPGARRLRGWPAVGATWLRWSECCEAGPFRGWPAVGATWLRPSNARPA